MNTELGIDYKREDEGSLPIDETQLDVHSWLVQGSARYACRSISLRRPRTWMAVMLSAPADLQWEDFRNKGYLHVRNFLEDAELFILERDWAERAKGAKGSDNNNYPIVDVPQAIVWRFHRKIKDLTDALHKATGLCADVDAGGNAYFSIEKGVDFCWHQDHESYFIYQQHLEYLNFYIPVIKPDARRTNLCLIPMDRLRVHVPEYFEKILGSGAKRYYARDGETFAYDDDEGSEYILPVDFEDLKEVPELNPGDLLLMRGDVIHRTQDTESARVAISFRRTSSTAPISRHRFEGGCAKKRDMMRNNWGLYQVMSDCLKDLQQDEITARQFHAYVMHRAGA